MLCSLRLRNIATISDTTLELSGGLNVLTGETGAGKSILVDGLLLALGERADHSIVRPGEKLATVEALFNDGESEILVRREVFSSGRSRILLDDELTDLETTRERMGELVDLHTQRSTPALLSRRVQQAFLDTRAGILDTASAVRGFYRRLGQIDQRAAELESALGASGSRRELLEHEASILGSLSPSREEYLGLSERRRLVEKDLKLRESLSLLSDLLSPEEGGFLKALRDRRMELLKAQGMEEITDLVREAEIAIEEASHICSSRLGAADDSWSIGDMDARLDEYGRLLGRYGGDIDRLMARVGEVAAELGGIAAMEEEFSALSVERTSVAAALAAGSGSSAWPGRVRGQHSSKEYRPSSPGSGWKAPCSMSSSAPLRGTGRSPSTGDNAAPTDSRSPSSSSAPIPACLRGLCSRFPVEGSSRASAWRSSSPRADRAEQPPSSTRSTAGWAAPWLISSPIRWRGRRTAASSWSSHTWPRSRRERTGISRW